MAETFDVLGKVILRLDSKEWHSLKEMLEIYADGSYRKSYSRDAVLLSYAVELLQKENRYLFMESNTFDVFTAAGRAVLLYRWQGRHLLAEKQSAFRINS